MRALSHVRTAALTHDLGLAAVPSFVLEKPQAKLTRAEWEQVRLHPYHGQRILSNVAALREVAELVGAHHERLDGTGYYRGLKQREIPAGARIIAVADHFDELTHETVNRPALPAEDAIRAMEREAGRHSPRRRWQPSAPAWELAWTSTPPGGWSGRQVSPAVRLMCSASPPARGLSRKQISEKLYVSESTVRTHMEHIYAKTGVSSRAAATLFAVENDLLR